MTLRNAVLELLACPKCGSPLPAGQSKLGCAACALEFLELEGILLLIPEAKEWLGRWKDTLDAFLFTSQKAELTLRDELKEPSLLPETRQRLAELVRSTLAQRTNIAEVLLPVVLALDPSLGASRSGVPPVISSSDRSLSNYYPNLLRDWGFGEEENRRSLELMQNAVPTGANLGKLVVLGAGGCRLAYDLQNSGLSEVTAVVDQNAFLFLAAKRIIRDSETLEFIEFQDAPQEHALSGARVYCAAKQALDPRQFAFLIADAVAPPFQASSVDTVLTPWLIDVIPEDLRAFIPRLNRILKSGGRWLNFGPLGYSHTKASLKYGRQELRRLIEISGFEIESWDEQEIPYLHSPNKGQKRFEEVIVFSAIKRQEATPYTTKPSNPIPQWASDITQCVPRLGEFAATQLLGDVLSLVDGTKSIADIAAIVAQRHHLDSHAAARVVKKFLLGVLNQTEQTSQSGADTGRQ